MSGDLERDMKRMSLCDQQGGTQEGGGVNVAQLSDYVQQCMSENSAQQIHGVTMVRQLVSVTANPCIDAVISSNVVPRLVQFLAATDNQALQFEAAWALSNLCSGTSEHAMVVLQCNAAPAMIQLLSSPNAHVQEQALWGIGNLAGDGPRVRDHLISMNAVQPLVAIVTDPSAQGNKILRTAVWCLANLCRGKPQPSAELLASLAPVFVGCLECQDREVVADACWGLAHVTDNDKLVESIISQVPRLVRVCAVLLQDQNPQVVAPALRVVGNLVTGPDLITQMVLNEGTLHCLSVHLQQRGAGLAKEAAWILSNICAGTAEQIQAVINANLVPSLMSCLQQQGQQVSIRQRSECGPELQREALWALSNITSGGTREQVRFLIEQGFVNMLVPILTATDAKLITVALESLENLLSLGASDAQESGGTNSTAAQCEVVGVLSALEQLQTHQNQSVYQRSHLILESYFDVDAEEDCVPGGGNTSGGFGFGGPLPRGGQGGFNF